MFLASLALATISVTLRLNLSFTSRVHPGMLIDHRARVFPAVATADALSYVLCTRTPHSGSISPSPSASASITTSYRPAKS